MFQIKVIVINGFHISCHVPKFHRMIGFDVIDEVLCKLHEK